MHNYTAYMMGSNGIVYRVEIMCDDEDAAKERARLLAAGNAVELWDGARLIAEYRPMH